MKIKEVFSHLYGKEALHFHHQALWSEICEVIETVDAHALPKKISDEARMKGREVFAPKEMNNAIMAGFRSRGWEERRTTYFVSRDPRINRKVMTLDPSDQKRVIEENGLEAILSFNQTDFVKDRIAVEVQFGKYAFVAFDLFVKHMAFFVADQIDIGIEILPMKELQAQMSSGPSYYEREIYNVIRQGRGIPAVPLVVLGIAP